MKRRVTLLITVGLAICLIVGIGIYVNVMKQDSKNGMRLETQDTTPSGMTLCLEWQNKDNDSVLSLSDKYQIEKLTFLGWKRAYEKPRVLEAEKWEDSGQYYQMWDLDWKFWLEKLPMGIYRVEKEITVVQNNGAEDEVVLYAPFLCGNWWTVLLGGLAILSIAKLVIVGKRNDFGKKRKIVMWTCFAVAFLLVGTVLFLYYYERTFGWVDVSYYMMLDEEKMEQMEFGVVSKFAWVNEKMDVPDKDIEVIELTLEQREDLVEALDGNVYPVRHLWYQYDAIVVIDDELEYAINTKERIAYVNYKDGYTEFFGYIELGREDNQKIKEILKQK